MFLPLIPFLSGAAGFLTGRNLFRKIQEPATQADIKRVTGPTDVGTKVRGAAGLAGAALGLPETNFSEGSLIGAFGSTPSNFPPPTFVPPTPDTSRGTTTTTTGGGGNQDQSQQQDQGQRQPTAEEIAARELEARRAAAESIYGETINILDELERQYEAERAPAEARLEASFQEGLLPLQEREAEQQSLIEQQQQAVREQEESAISQARRRFNELMQRGISRFGAGTSAGPAFSEIIGRATAEQLGTAGNIATQGFNALADESRRLKDFVGRQRENLENQKNIAKQELQNQFAENLRQIRAQKGQAAIEKQNAMVDALREIRAQALQIELADRAYQQQLNLFEKQKASELARSYAVNTAPSATAINALANLSERFGLPGALAIAPQLGVDTSVLQGIINLGALQNVVEDPPGSGVYIDLNTGRRVDINPSGAGLLRQQVGR